MLFDEEKHEYSLNGEIFISVTTVINTVLFETFDEDRISTAIVEKKNKPITDKYYNLTQIEIKQVWENDRELGILLHKTIEEFYNNKPVNITREFELFLKFELYEIHYKGLFFYKSEYRIYDKGIKVAGTVDVIYKYDKNSNHIIIGDFKRSNRLIKTNPYKSGIVWPTKNTPDCNYMHYSFQLMLYKYILENSYGYIVDKMLIILLHPSQENYIIEEINDCPQIFNNIIQYLKDINTIGFI